jgi:hypothetical protein
MSLALGSAKLATGAPPAPIKRVSRQHLVSTSIAEKAIFIPKPHKRVDFKLQAPGLAPMGNREINLPGSGELIKDDIKGANLTKGSLGSNGVTARFNSRAYKGSPGGYVKMEIDLTPEKQMEVIATQEEGRQINHKEIHFTQQYDTYGRPRIGFSREPYDFAAAKYVSITSQITFQENMERTHEAFEKYSLSNKRAEAGADVPDKPEVKFLGADNDQSKELPVLGETSDTKTDGEGGEVNEEFFLGSKSGSEEEQNSEGEGRVSAEESYKTQKVKVVDVFNMDDGSSGGSESGQEKSTQVKSIDVTA